MIALLQELFSANFMPHAMCLRDAPLIHLHVVSDALIAFAYLVIPLALCRIVKQRRDLVFSWMFLLFGLFILGCGFTHAISIWTLWHPIYRFEGLIKALTALVSLGTAVCLVRLIPALVGLPSPAQLQAEIAERTRAEAEVKRLNEDLERRIGDRTAALSVSREALSQTNERLNMALAAGSVGTWDLNLDTGEMISDVSCRTSFGLAPQSGLTYERAMAAIHPEDRQCVAEAIATALRSDSNGQYEAEYRTVGSVDGTLRHVHAKGRRFYVRSDEGNFQAHLLGTTLDVTTKKRIEEALLQANDDLRQFAYAAAHDLQEPLRNVCISVELLDMSWSDRWDEEARTLVRESIEGAQRIHQMIKDLLAYTKIIDDFSPIDCSNSAEAALKEALANMSNKIQQSQVQIHWDELPCLHVSKIHLLQLFQNLIGNAIKYSRRGTTPEVHVSAWQNADKWMFQVSDNGIGFDQEYAERIFGIFKRLHQRDEYVGNGIGLAICARIVNHYGGQIWAEGRPGKGATFTFTLPV